MDYYTIPVSLAGLPSLSVPCGSALPDGGTRPMPLGLQLASPLFAERALLGIAHAYEQATATRDEARAPEFDGRDVIDARRGEIRSGDRHRVPRRAEDRQQDVLRVPQRVRRRAEYEGVPGVPRVAGRAAGAERARDRADDQGRASRSTPRSRRFPSSTARTTSIPTCPRTIRSRSTTCRSRRAASCTTGWPTARRSRAGSRASIWKKIPASRPTRVRVTAASPVRRTRWSTSTGPACR